jgi:CRP/FNR family transcriptional regulator
VVAAEETELLLVPKRDVVSFCRAHPEVALAALRALSIRLRKATGMVEELALRGVGRRVAEYLLAQARWTPGAGERPIELELRDSNGEIADQLGSVREVVSRAFATLERRGWIVKARRRVRIRRPEELAAFARGL